MKNQRGITLIALVITIIVLLILAGVTIAMLTGDNSILNRATEASYTNDIAEGKDQVSVAWNAAYTTYLAKYYTNTLATGETFGKILKTELDKIADGGTKYQLEGVPTAATGFPEASSGSATKITLRSQSNKNKISEATVTLTSDATGSAVTKGQLSTWGDIKDSAPQS